MKKTETIVMLENPNEKNSFFLCFSTDGKTESFAQLMAGSRREAMRLVKRMNKVIMESVYDELLFPKLDSVSRPAHNRKGFSVQNG